MVLETSIELYGFGLVVVANHWPNDPLYLMGLMVGKQPLLPMEWQWFSERQPLHYGIGAVIFEKNIRKCSTLKIDFFANFHLTHDFLLAEALSTPQKLENAKRNLQISI